MLQTFESEKQSLALQNNCVLVFIHHDWHTLVANSNSSKLKEQSQLAHIRIR